MIAISKYQPIQIYTFVLFFPRAICRDYGTPAIASYLAKQVIMIHQPQYIATIDAGVCLIIYPIVSYIFIFKSAFQQYSV